MKIARALWTAIALLGAGLAGCQPTAPSNALPSAAPTTISADIAPTRTGAVTAAQAQMLLGNPDDATNSPSNRQRYLIRREQYALSYNDVLRFPNWVSWHLAARDSGSTGRGQFQPDPDLPDGSYRVTPSDYTGSGYDRGHNCPSADRSDTPENNDAVFYMSNMTPQTHGLNAGPWERLESFCRDLAKQGNELYITCGHGFSAPSHQTIGRAAIAVPDFAWKVVVVLPEKAGDDLARITPQTRVIAVKMPNIDTVSASSWTQYTVTPDAIEKATGLHFFAALPTQTAAALKAKMDGESPIVAHRTRTASHDQEAAPDAAAASGMVWVNLSSGVYWRPNTEYYGKTKRGKYLSERDAIAAGYHAPGERP